MTVSKKFMHDRLILLLLSVEVFMAVFGGLMILLKLGGGHGSNYIVQYRSNLGFNAFKTGGAADLAGFIIFLFMVLGIHTMLSIKLYPLKRQLSVMVLEMGVLLMLLAIIVSNALLALR